MKPKRTQIVKRLTLLEAAAYLDVKSEKTIRRLIKTGKLPAEQRTAQGKKRWLIEESALVLYKAEKAGWFRRAFSPIPPIDGYGKHIGFTLILGEWDKDKPLEEEQVSERTIIVDDPNIDDPNRLKTFKLEVSLDDLCRFVRCCPQSKQEFEAIKNELRLRLYKAPQNF